MLLSKAVQLQGKPEGQTWGFWLKEGGWQLHQAEGSGCGAAYAWVWSILFERWRPFLGQMKRFCPRRFTSGALRQKHISLGCCRCSAHIWWNAHAIRGSCLAVSFIVGFTEMPSGLLDSKLLTGHSPTVISKCIHRCIDPFVYVHFIATKGPISWPQVD